MVSPYLFLRNPLSCVIRSISRTKRHSEARTANPELQVSSFKLCPTDVHKKIASAVEEIRTDLLAYLNCTEDSLETRKEKVKTYEMHLEHFVRDSQSISLVAENIDSATCQVCKARHFEDPGHRILIVWADINSSLVILRATLHNQSMWTQVQSLNRRITHIRALVYNLELSLNKTQEADESPIKDTQDTSTLPHK